ncbi:hypothetical protein M885DRAFT_54390 [Pelagophyceae sp. CCMP2097]|nr:hypothetical protein M885DRAFT_54390 [Pelagophyceae sp. CCMP2097]
MRQQIAVRAAAGVDAQLAAMRAKIAKRELAAHRSDCIFSAASGSAADADAALDAPAAADAAAPGDAHEDAAESEKMQSEASNDGRDVAERSRRRSLVRRSLVRRSLARRSLARRSLVRRSLARRSLVRRSLARRSLVRRSLVRRSLVRRRRRLATARRRARLRSKWRDTRPVPGALRRKARRALRRKARLAIFREALWRRASRRARRGGALAAARRATAPRRLGARRTRANSLAHETARETAARGGTTTATGGPTRIPTCPETAGAQTAARTPFRGGARGATPRSVDVRRGRGARWRRASRTALRPCSTTSASGSVEFGWTAARLPRLARHCLRMNSVAGPDMRGGSRGQGPRATLWPPQGRSRRRKESPGRHARKAVDGLGARLRQKGPERTQARGDADCTGSTAPWTRLKLQSMCDCMVLGNCAFLGGFGHKRYALGNEPRRRPKEARTRPTPLGPSFSRGLFPHVPAASFHTSRSSRGEKETFRRPVFQRRVSKRFLKNVFSKAFFKKRF